MIRSEDEGWSSKKGEGVLGNGSEATERRRAEEREEERAFVRQQRLAQWALKTENKRYCSALFRIDICEYGTSTRVTERARQRARGSVI